MNKQIRMTENKYYHYINLNPKNKYCSDCVVRAIANVLSEPWEDVVRDMTEFGIKNGMVLNDTKLFPKYLQHKGFKECGEPRNAYNKKISVREFIDHISMFKDLRFKKMIVKCGSHHVSSVIDCQVNDTWDCSAKTLHRYWVK